MTERQIELAKLYKLISSGVYIIGVSNSGIPHGFTAASVILSGANPLTLVIGINTQHLSYKFLRELQECSVNVLGTGDDYLVKKFGKPLSRDKFEGVKWHWGKNTKTPILDDALATFECKVVCCIETGTTHAVVILRIVEENLGENRSKKKPMLYADLDLSVDNVVKLFPSKKDSKL